MLLAADVGNTRIAFGLFDGATLVERWSIRTDRKKSGDEYGLLIRQLFEMRGAPTESAEAAVLASVVPDVDQAIGSALAGICNAQLLVLGPDTPLGIRNLYDNPEEVGADRLANAVGCQALRGAPGIVVDFGTATTFDVVNPDGDYLGGVIIPGIDMSARALFSETAKLPRVTPKRPKRVVGKNTISSIRSGLFWGYVGAVDGLVEQLWKELEGQWPVVATGSNAASVASASKYIEHVEPDLTLHGLRIIWERNQ